MPNPTEATAEALDLAVASGEYVVLTTWQGRELRGTLAEHPTEPGVYRVRTGGRGRPAQVHREDVEEVTFA